MVNPMSSIRNPAPTSESGIATSGMITERMEPRKRKITIMTMMSASMSVSTTSLMAPLIYAVASYGMLDFSPAGSCATSSG